MYYLCNLSVSFKFFLTIVEHYKDKIPILNYKEEKNSDLAVEKPGRQHLNQIIKVDIASNQT